MRLGLAAVMVLLLTGVVHAAEWNSLWRQEKYCPADRKHGYCDPDRVQRKREVDEAYRTRSSITPRRRRSHPIRGAACGQARRRPVNKKKKKR